MNHSSYRNKNFPHYCVPYCKFLVYTIISKVEDQMEGSVAAQAACWGPTPDRSESV